ncbi:probable helicase senataxin isoform X4 [Sapajus apella]|uniref:Probable helicase senataxin n=1 Tax=Sapajus apella TaxID=9515 RepID=A0A6J3G6U8_SAPAP|nr:probable helicase senataxin isoform X4 [Sapajus apella]XP_032113572.1 probable helicase senataxin isoform X4 [Sapajus apella]
MSTCCWCTPGGVSTTDFLKHYASNTRSSEFQTANEDLCYCLECVAEYHKARDELPYLHEVLWELETLRLINHFEKSMKAEIGDDDELYIVDNNGEMPLFDITGQDFENKLRVPLLEILKYPYLLLHERVNELCVEALCRMEQANCSFQVFDKHPGIYLFLVHPNEMVRRWAILTARNLGKVDRDDYYDLQEVLTCLFKVIELGLLESPDIYTSSVLEKGKLILLPSHMYDTTNYKNYWLGICMLLTILEEQAMDSLLLGSDKQNDFMQLILHTMERQSDDDSVDPFWPALHCFMLILDRLGSKVWGQLIDPIEAFQTIINNTSYNREIQHIRNSSVRTKVEPESYLDDMVTCSQIVYNFNPEKTKKDSGWRTAICPDYCPNMYEEMETLANVLQSDIGQDMRVHNSTFLWFIPFVQSLMDLKDLGVAYIVEVIHHLYSEVKDVLNQTDAVCDKVTEFFLLILVSVIELHRNKKCLHLLWVSSQQWVEAVVKCAKLPTTAFARSSEKSSGNCSKGTAMISSLSLHSMPSNSVQLACVQLIRSLLKEGYQLGQHSLCKRFWDKLNLFLRGNLSLGWQLTSQETHELQTCLKQIIRNIKFKAPPCNTFVDLTSTCKTSPACYNKEESEQIGKKPRKDTHCWGESSPTFSKEPVKVQDNVLIKADNSIEGDNNEQNSIKDVKLEDHLSAGSCLKRSSKNHFTERAEGPIKISTRKQKSVKENSSYTPKNCTSRNGPERGCDRGIIVSTHLLTDSSTDALEKVSASNEDLSLKGNGLAKTSKRKTKVQKDEIRAKLSHVIKKHHRKSTLVNNAINLDENLTVSNTESFYSRKDTGVQKGDGFIHNLSLDTSGVLDGDKNGEQKSQNNLVPKEKQLKNAELDIFSSRENNCKIQECHVDKDLIPFTEMTDTLVKKTLVKKSSSFNDLMTVPESRDKEMSNNTNLISFSLTREQAPVISPKSDTLTDSQIDRDLHKLSLIAQASVIKFPSDSPQNSSQLQRKVKEHKRCFTANQNNVGDTSCGQVIIISDSDDDDDETVLSLEKLTKQDKICIEKESPGQHVSIVNSKEEKNPVKEEKTKSLLQLEECDSQCFEFESPFEVFSVWQDNLDNNNSVQDDEKNCLTHVASITNDQGCTDYVSEVVKKGAEGIEEHVRQNSSISVEEFCEIEVKKPKRKRSEKPMAEDLVRPSSSVINEGQSDTNKRDLVGNDFKSIAGRTTTTNSSIQRATTVSQKKSSKLCTYSEPVKKVPVSKNPKKTHSDAKKGQNKSSNYLSCRTTPAIVLPKKFRQCPEPTSTAERLRLKKAPRMAFELSQRSLDYLAQLRDHGRAVGVVDAPKKTKLIPPQNLSVRNNKKLLISQELQMRRQMRPKSQKNRRGLSGCKSTDATRTGLHTAQKSDTSVPEADRSDYSCAGGTEVLASSNGKQIIKCVPSEPETTKAKHGSLVTDDVCLLNQCDSVVLNGTIPINEVIVATSEDPLGGGDLSVHHIETATLKEGEPDPSSDTEEDNLFLTQHDPEDMDLCSQMENDNYKFIELIHGKDTVQVEEDSVNRPQLESLIGTKCKYKDCVEATKNQGEYCSEHSEVKAADEDVFRKPGLPLSASKPLRPTTAKIFSSKSTSRIASLSKSLESSPPSLKNKSNGIQSILKVPQPTPLVSQKPVGEMNSCNVLQPQSPNNSNRQGCKVAFGESKYFPSSSPVNIFLTSQSVSDTFVKEVLKWKYEMFLNFNQCGPPASLCQSISRPVPVRFHDCGDYFSVFFPLMVLNTFETVAQEWLTSPNKENFYQLQVRKFPADYIKYWEFVVYLEECELAKQLYPKENDLVFLIPERINEEKKDTEGNDMQDLREYHCGYVHKFRRTSVMRNGKFECYLSIQTQENFPANLNELVNCIVISSLVTTQRKLKAMSLLGSRNQLARAVLNPNPMDFCTKDLLTTTSERIISYLRDFNEDQKKAIETAYAMVKHSPSVAKICLIHGPPGTGKSKTIVGLLYRLLTENQRKGHSDENSNAKIKQNRVLVCAPSNAAVDELMKKIILEFKEKCKDKKNPLGNCGDINLVRLGPEKSINNEVLKFSLDSQVNHRMKKDLPSHVQEMHRRKEFLDYQLDELSRQRALCRGGREIQRQELDEKISEVSKERQELASKIKEVQGRPQKTQNNIILESHVICCTLSTSGGLLLESAFRGQGGVPFSCVIVDEAGQSCEIETLTPLIHRCNKLILVGDPKQLPPTVISMKAQEYGYDQSMMARFCKLLEENVEHNMISRLPILRLTIQYRMHPDICLFPSNYVYNRNLKTNRQTETIRCSSDWPFQPYLVFDVGDGSERRDNDSYVNVQEIKLVMELIKLIKDKRKDVTFRNIGIITHYKAQKTMIQKDLDKEFDRKGPAEVDTVDAFQGRQKDCVIVTCVRANTMQGSIGFLASLQRLNVTITRAKYSLFILGHLRTLMENQHWNQLIQDAQKRGAIIKTCDKNYRHDVTKILKLKPVLQRSLTHPPAIAPEVSRPQGGLPSPKLDSGFTKTSFAASLYHTPSDSKEAPLTVISKDPERPPVQDQLRDPRLLKRMGVEVKGGIFLWDPQPSSPQHPGVTPPAGEPGFPGVHQDLGNVLQPSALVAALSSLRPPVQGEPPTASTEASTCQSKCDDPDGELCHRRDARAFSEGEQENCGSETHYTKRNSRWDKRRLEKEESNSKKRKLL